MRARLAATLLFLCVATAALAQYAGRPLRDALTDLQGRGLKLIYSDEVVPPEMIVKREPHGGEPRRILEELLRQQGLRADNGPNGTLVIVRGERPPRDSAAAAAMPVALAEITVTPSRFTLFASSPHGRQFLDRDAIRRLSHFSDDTYRALARLPGTAGVDVSARFNLRGGEEDEVQVLLDGAEIPDPFHLRDLLRIFSTIDSNTIGSADVLSGGYPVEYGGRMSGVVDIETLQPEQSGGEAGVSLLHIHALSYGTFRASHGSWLASFRHGYLREVLAVLDPNADIDPRYDDLSGKLQWIVGNGAVTSLHVLYSSDRLHLFNDPGSKADGTYRDLFVWANAGGAFTPRVFGHSVVSVSNGAFHRRGSFDNTFKTESGSMEESRSSSRTGWSGEATFDVSDRSLWRAGASARSGRANYDYRGESAVLTSSFNLGAQPRFIDRVIEVAPHGTELACYASGRFRLGDTVVVEAGARAAEESFIPASSRIMPRLNLAWSVRPATTIRAAWGIFDQTQRIDELQVEDGVTEFSPPQRAEHRVVTVEQQFERGWLARMDVYDKHLSHLRPRFENLFDRISLFPELRGDRFRVAPESGRARGVEVHLRTPATAPVTGWVTYALASVTDRIDGRDVPREWDQRHAVTASADWTRHGWNVNVAATYHSAWPTTPVEAAIIDGKLRSAPGPLRSSRLTEYRRFDMRLSRSISKWELFVEMFNIFGRPNTIRIDDFAYRRDSAGNVVATPDMVTGLKFVPSFGVTRHW